MTYVYINPKMIIYKYNKGKKPKYFLQTPNAEWKQKN